MNTVLSWAYLAPWFLGPLLVTSAIGFACYLFVHWFEDVFWELLVILELPLFLGALGFIITAFPFSLISVAVLALVCGTGTFAERAILPMESSWGAVFLRLLFTTACCIALSVGLLLLVSP